MVHVHLADHDTSRFTGNKNTNFTFHAEKPLLVPITRSFVNSVVGKQEVGWGLGRPRGVDM